MKDEDSNSKTGIEQPVAMLDGELPSARPRHQEQLAAQPKPDATSLSQAIPSVELHIEELLLHGFHVVNRHRIGEALERELSRLFTEQAVPPAMTREVDHACLDGGTFELRLDSDAEAIGTQLAQAIYGGLVS
jgi:hypothetical protein